MMLSHEKFLSQLKDQGVVVLPELMKNEQLSAIKNAFECQLQQPSFNAWQGYHQTDRRRLMVDQLLTVDQGFVDVALLPLIQSVVKDYLGEAACLQEAKGWRSLPFNDNYHPFHRDEWYCRDYYDGQIKPMSLKLGLYLDDVDTGAFAYIPRSHRDASGEHTGVDEQASIFVTGKAGTIFLFDPEGLHQQTFPNLKKRNAAFYHFFSSDIVLSQNFIRWGRFRQLLIESSYLHYCSPEQLAFLGIGRQPSNHPIEIEHFRWARRSMNGLVRGINEGQYWFQRVQARLNRR
jgi:ectoine hydroxylase-related dioxygenase (phytanoyl-CoA dioxygenase family)